VRACLSGGGRDPRGPKLLASCNHPVESGMVVHTDSEQVRQTRRVVLELLLGQAPDSTELAKLARTYGVESTRFEPKPRGKCILCGLCVRVCSELMGRSAISIFGRGAKREVSTPFREPTDQCQACGACAFVCPTGAVDLEAITSRRPHLTSRATISGSVRDLHRLAHLRPPPGAGHRPRGLRPPTNGRVRAVLPGLRRGCHRLQPNADGPRSPSRRDLADSGVRGLRCDAAGRVRVRLFPERDHPSAVRADAVRIRSNRRPYPATVRRKPSAAARLRSVRGSRDRPCGKDYCSSVCCMAATKEAILAKEHEPGPMSPSSCSICGLSAKTSTGTRSEPEPSSTSATSVPSSRGLTSYPGPRTFAWSTSTSKCAESRRISI